MSDKKYSNLHPKELEKFKKKLKNAMDAMYKGTLTSVSTQKREREKLRKEAIEEARQKIVKPSKSMMVDTTTGMGANIFLMPKKKPKKNKK